MRRCRARARRRAQVRPLYLLHRYKSTNNDAREGAAAAAEAAAGAAREVEKLRAQAQHLQHQLLAAEEHAGKAAEAAAAAHGAVVEGLQGMLAQSEVTQPYSIYC